MICANLDQISSLESWPSINYKISTKYQDLDELKLQNLNRTSESWLNSTFKILTKPSFRISRFNFITSTKHSTSKFWPNLVLKVWKNIHLYLKAFSRIENLFTALSGCCDIDDHLASFTSIKSTKQQSVSQIVTRVAYDPIKNIEDKIIPNNTTQYSRVQPTTAHYSTVQPTTAQYSPIQPSTAHQGPEQPSIAKYSQIQPTTAQYSPKQPSTSKLSPVQPGTVHYSLVKPITAQYSPLQPSTIH